MTTVPLHPSQVFDVTCPNCHHDINEHYKKPDDEPACYVCRCDWSPNQIASFRLTEAVLRHNIFLSDRVNAEDLAVIYALQSSMNEDDKP